jgi:hypothetical protein
MVPTADILDAIEHYRSLVSAGDEEALAAFLGQIQAELDAMTSCKRLSTIRGAIPVRLRRRHGSRRRGRCRNA